MHAGGARTINVFRGVRQGGLRLAYEGGRGRRRTGHGVFPVLAAGPAHLPAHGAPRALQRLHAPQLLRPEGLPADVPRQGEDALSRLLQPHPSRRPRPGRVRAQHSQRDLARGGGGGDAAGRRVEPLSGASGVERRAGAGARAAQAGREASSQTRSSAHAASAGRTLHRVLLPEQALLDVHDFESGVGCGREWGGGCGYEWGGGCGFVDYSII